MFPNVNIKNVKWVPESVNHEYVEAWEQGKTGFPAVDATMR